MGVLEAVRGGGSRWLICVAAPREAEAVAAGLGGRFDRAAAPAGPSWTVAHESDRFAVVLTGVGKASAAAAASFHLARGGFAGVVSLGIGGALPASGLGLRDVVVADRSVLADEGLATGDGFRTLEAMGFGPGVGGGMGAPGDEQLVAALARDLSARVGTIATVSTCSGTDELAAEVGARTGAIVEAMEGAAVGIASAGASAAGAGAGGAIAFAEVRVVSNTTGDRAGQAWDLDGALRRLRDVAGRL